MLLTIKVIIFDNLFVIELDLLQKATHIFSKVQTHSHVQMLMHALRFLFING